MPPSWFLLPRGGTEEVDLYADEGPRVRDVTTLMLVLASIFVVLRFWARWIQVIKVGLDDYLVAASLIIFYMGGMVTYLMVNSGLGRHVDVVSDKDEANFLKLFFGFEIVYLTQLMLIKIAILQFYLRIFPNRSFRIAAYLLMGFTLIWWVTFVCTILFSCDPIARAYTPSLPGTCIDMRALVFGNAVPNIVTDVIVLILPIHQVVRLQLSKLKKLSLVVMFLSGSFATFCSLYRVVSLIGYSMYDKSWSIANPQLWSVVEVGVCIISACLPTLRPLFTAARNLIWSKDAASSKRKPLESTTYGSGGSFGMNSLKASHCRSLKGGGDSGYESEPWAKEDEFVPGHRRSGSGNTTLIWSETASSGDRSQHSGLHQHHHLGSGPRYAPFPPTHLRDSRV